MHQKFNLSTGFPKNNVLIKKNLLNQDESKKMIYIIRKLKKPAFIRADSNDKNTHTKQIQKDLIDLQNITLNLKAITSFTVMLKSVSVSLSNLRTEYMGRIIYKIKRVMATYL
jgi:hypothetical protein